MAILRRIQATDGRLKAVDYIFGTSDYLATAEIKAAVAHLITDAMQEHCSFAPIPITGDISAEDFKALLLAAPCPCTDCGACVVVLETATSEELWVKGDGKLTYL